MPHIGSTSDISSEFPRDNWPLSDGNSALLSEVHWENHGKPHHHPPPHQHHFYFDGKVWLRTKGNNMLPFNPKKQFRL